MNPAIALIAATLPTFVHEHEVKIPQMLAARPLVEVRQTRFQERRSYRAQVREARKRRNVAKRGGAR